MECSFEGAKDSHRADQQITFVGEVEPSVAVYDVYSSVGIHEGRGLCVVELGGGEGASGSVDPTSGFLEGVSGENDVFGFPGLVGERSGPTVVG